MHLPPFPHRASQMAAVTATTGAAAATAAAPAAEVAPPLLRTRVAHVLLTAAAAVPVALSPLAAAGLPVAVRAAFAACHTVTVLLPPAINFVTKGLPGSQARKAAQRSAGAGAGPVGERSRDALRLILREVRQR